MNKQKILDQRGFSLLELGLTLAISALIVGALWVYVSNVTENDRKNKFMNQTTQIIVNARRVFANNLSDMSNMSRSAVMTPAAIQSGIFPAEMLTEGSNTPLNVYQGATTLAYTNAFADGLSLSMQNITGDACVALLSKIAREAVSRRQYGIYALSVGKTGALGQDGGIKLNGTGDIPQQTLIGYCTPPTRSKTPGRIPLGIYFRIR